MKKVLGLDISSSTIGWSLISFDDNSIELNSYGHIKPPKSSSGTLTFRINSAYSQIKELLTMTSPDAVSIEAYANKFASGRSSARTIIVLSVFNELCALACLREHNVEPEKYNVLTVRSKISKFFNKKISSKDDTFLCISNFFDKFKIIKNRSGNIKKECYDEADAIAVSLCYILNKREGL